MFVVHDGSTRSQRDLYLQYIYVHMHTHVIIDIIMVTEYAVARYLLFIIGSSSLVHLFMEL
jgi:hypothetical protein